jgi:Holliday junction resolvase-like predicted endonuclease
VATKLLKEITLRIWGEIDIVASKNGVIHFIEVKSVMRKRSETRDYYPEENVHVLKQRRLRRVIQTYLLEKRIGLGAEFLFHVVVVYMDMKTRRASVSFIENVIL